MEYELYHSNGRSGWAKKNAKYIKREWKNGKWVYVYPKDLKTKSFGEKKYASRFFTKEYRQGLRDHAGEMYRALNNINSPGSQRSSSTGNTAVKGAKSGASQRATNKTAPKKYNAIQKLLGVDKRDAYRKASSAHNAAKKLASSGNHDRAQRNALKQNVNRTYNNYNKAAKAYKSTPLGKLDSASEKVAKKLSQGKAYVAKLGANAKKKLSDSSVAKSIKRYNNVKKVNSQYWGDSKENLSTVARKVNADFNKKNGVSDRIEKEQANREYATLLSQEKAKEKWNSKNTTVGKINKVLSGKEKDRTNTSYGETRSKINSNIATENKNRQEAMAKQAKLNKIKAYQNDVNSNIDRDRKNREAAQTRGRTYNEIRQNDKSRASEHNRQRTQSSVDDRIELERKQREAAERRSRAARKN